MNRPNRSDRYQYLMKETHITPEHWASFQQEERDSPETKEQLAYLHEQLFQRLTLLMRQHLTEKQRQVIALTLEGMTQAEIAKALNKNQSSITKSLHGSQLEHETKKHGGSFKRLRKVANQDSICQYLQAQIQDLISPEPITIPTVNHAIDPQTQLTFSQIARLTNTTRQNVRCVLKAKSLSSPASLASLKAKLPKMANQVEKALSSNPESAMAPNQVMGYPIPPTEILTCLDDETKIPHALLAKALSKSTSAIHYMANKQGIQFPLTFHELKQKAPWWALKVVQFTEQHPTISRKELAQLLDLTTPQVTYALKHATSPLPKYQQDIPLEYLEQQFPHWARLIKATRM